ncbi:hypothetical protein PWT90_08772 [Aphanocladium album]|nr:hypothetical protein PWT90_08772 [Aphanocladium album]
MKTAILTVRRIEASMIYFRYMAGDQAAARNTTEQYTWLAPLDEDKEWLSGLHRAVQEIHITYGGFEVVADDAKALASVLRAVAPEVAVRLEQGPKEPYDAVVMEYDTKQPDGPVAKRMKRWHKSYMQEELPRSASSLLRRDGGRDMRKLEVACLSGLFSSSSVIEEYPPLARFG